MTTIAPIAAVNPDPSLDRPETCALSLAEQLDAEAEEMSQRQLRQLVTMAEVGMELVGMSAGGYRPAWRRTMWRCSVNWA